MKSRTQAFFYLPSIWEYCKSGPILYQVESLRFPWPHKAREIISNFSKNWPLATASNELFFLFPLCSSHSNINFLACSGDRVYFWFTLILLLLGILCDWDSLEVGFLEYYRVWTLTLLLKGCWKGKPLPEFANVASLLCLPLLSFHFSLNNSLYFPGFVFTSSVLLRWF